jgi:hypothetical protein
LKNGEVAGVLRFADCRHVCRYAAGFVPSQVFRLRHRAACRKELAEPPQYQQEALDQRAKQLARVEPLASASYLRRKVSVCDLKGTLQHRHFLHGPSLCGARMARIMLVTDRSFKAT